VILGWFWGSSGLFSDGSAALLCGSGLFCGGSGMVLGCFCVILSGSGIILGGSAVVLSGSVWFWMYLRGSVWFWAVLDYFLHVPGTPRTTQNHPKQRTTKKHLTHPSELGGSRVDV
jgi:hypothetical protein